MYEDRFETESVNNKPRKKKSKAGLVIGLIAAIIVSLAVGSGATYLFMRGIDFSRFVDIQTFDNTDNDDLADTDDYDDEDITDEEVVDDEDVYDDQTQQDEPTTDIADITIGTTTDDTEMEPVVADSGLSVADIAAKCMPSVVAITNIGETEVRSMWGNFTTQSESAGSGIIVGQTDDELLILTNYHVVADNSTLSVVFSWEEGAENGDDADIINAVIKDYNMSRDIAVIAIKMADLSADTISNIAIATVGSSDDLVLGEQVVAIGNALGYGQSVTTGIVSALNREIDTNVGANGKPNVYIQTDAAINPGNSGGALFNMMGELVGVNSAKMGGDTIEGMGYAIPISEIMDEVEIMMTQETRTAVDEDKRGYLGISIVDVTSDISTTYGLPQGAYISSVNAGSGAEKAGLQKEDIIVAVNGKSVTSSSELKDYLSYYEVGEVVTITVARKTDGGYENVDIDVILGEAPQPQGGNGGGASGDGNTGNSGNSSSDDFDDSNTDDSYDPFGD